MMKIKKVIIDNFRNIVHAEYDLMSRSIFAGPNRQGKTNTILAIYWALTDLLLDGSSDYQSFKPGYIEEAEVSVELVCDAFTLKKVYKGWRPRQQGSGDPGDLQHTTDYWIDGTKYKTQSEAKRALLKLLGTDRQLETSKFDLTRTLIDPYYIGQECDYKTLRSFIVEVAGDVSNEDVFAADPMLLVIRDLMARYQYDPGLAQKFIKQQVATVKKDIETSEQQVKGLESVQDVDPTLLKEAQESINQIDKQIAGLQVQLSGRDNPQINEAKLKLSDLTLKLAESRTKDMEAVQEHNRQIEVEISRLQKVQQDATWQAQDLIRRKVSAENAILGNDQRIASIEKQKSELESRKAELLQQYHVRNAEEYTQPETQEERCPNCGYVLNQEALESYRCQWESNKQRDLDYIIRQGKQLNNDIENLRFKIEELRKGKASAEENLPLIKQEIRSFETEAQQAQDSVGQLRKQLTDIVDSEQTTALREAVKATQDSYDNLVKAQQASVADVQAEIQRLNAETLQYRSVLDDHGAYVATQKKAAAMRSQIKTKEDTLIDFEQQSILIDRFLEIKLGLFQRRISNVFGDRVQFTLIKYNLKKGSWDEVCYPSVLDKNTPFEDGSGSEKILTGIYLAECVKRHLGLGDLPYIFDECDKLDTASLAAIPTQAQIITTKVDDVNYNKVTLITA